jgi:tRNA U34 5-carboxymethylaminomethyl modifying GTPase MnmE/TrmE
VSDVLFLVLVVAVAVSATAAVSVAATWLTTRDYVEENRRLSAAAVAWRDLAGEHAPVEAVERVEYAIAADAQPQGRHRRG